MSPIRIGLIGLSASAKTAWASAAHLPYLLSPRGLERFRIVALCNSSKESAEAAIANFKLSPETRAYGSPAELAADPNVDLVVCSTRVDVHYETIRPALEAGKMVYCEWPLAQDLQHVRDLVEISRSKQLRTMIGVQGRVAPAVLKVKELIESGRIGDVVSVEVRAAGGLNDRQIIPATLEYFTRKEVGGNIITIGLGHLWDQIQFVHGDATILHSRFQLQFPTNKIRDSSGTNTIIKTVTSTVPDLAIVTASLPASYASSTQKDSATLLVRFNRGQPSFSFAGSEPSLVWSIVGSKGEVRLTSTAGTGLHASGYAPGGVSLEVLDFENGEVDRINSEHGEVERIDPDSLWAKPWQEELPLLSRSVGALYEAFADGKGYPTFEDALKRHEQIDEMFAAWKV
ncbi:oxidoreductase family protein [Favolaschia claudopus]|uniref:Oxidoreductase family protein n=1 Tax=Favolaschia claudopus TaxID=2862362 RepID=A0AAW0AFP9_9AGAR